MESPLNMNKNNRINYEFPFSVKAGLSLKKYGPMNTAVIKESFLKEIGCNRVLITLSQKHTKKVHVIDEKYTKYYADSIIVGDGLITENKNLVLGVTVADCMPIYLSNRKGTVYGILHSGWKGTGILKKACNILNTVFRIPPEDIRVILGPSIRPCCYNVDPVRAKYFSDEWGADSIVKRNNKYFIDLVAANLSILAEAGIRNFHVINDCTFCNDELGSYRREGSKNYTKMLAYIATN